MAAKNKSSRGRVNDDNSLRNEQRRDQAASAAKNSGAKPVKSTTKTNTADTKGISQGNQTQRGTTTKSVGTTSKSSGTKPVKSTTQTNTANTKGRSEQTPRGTYSYLARSGTGGYHEAELPSAGKTLASDKARGLGQFDKAKLGEARRQYESLVTKLARSKDDTLPKRDTTRLSAAFQQIADAGYRNSETDIAALGNDAGALKQLRRNSARYGEANRQIKLNDNLYDTYSEMYAAYLKDGTISKSQYDEAMARLESGVREANAAAREEMANAHRSSEYIRAINGYSGGAAGNQYLVPDLPDGWEDNLSEQVNVNLAAEWQNDPQAAARQAAKGGDTADAGAAVYANPLREVRTAQATANWFDRYGTTDEDREFADDALRYRDSAYDVLRDRTLGERVSLGVEAATKGLVGGTQSGAALLDQYIVEPFREYADNEEFRGKVDRYSEAIQLRNRAMRGENLTPEQMAIAETANEKREQVMQYAEKDFVLSDTTKQLLSEANLAQARATSGLGYFDTAVAGGLISAVQNLPAIAATILTENPLIGTSLMGMMATGQEAYQRSENGENIRELAPVSLARGGVEILTEYASADYLLKIAKSQEGRLFLNKLFGGILESSSGKKSFLIRTGGNIVALSAIEGSEEVAADFLNFLTDIVRQDENASISFEQCLQSFIGGAVAGALMGGPGTVAGAVGDRLNNSGRSEDEWQNLRDEYQNRKNRERFGEQTISDNVRVLMDMQREGSIEWRGIAELAADEQFIKELEQATWTEAPADIMERNAWIVNSVEALSAQDDAAPTQDETELEPEQVPEPQANPAENETEPDDTVEQDAKAEPERVDVPVENQSDEMQKDAPAEEIETAEQERRPEDVQERPVEITEQEQEEQRTEPPKPVQNAEQARAELETVKQLAVPRNFGENGQKAFRDSFEIGQTATEYFEDFARIYNEALAGNFDEGTDVLSHEQTMAAIKAAQADRGVVDAAARNTVRAKNAGAAFGEWEHSNISRKHRRAMDKLAKAFGVRVSFVDELEKGNASYSGSDVTISRKAIAEGANPVSFLVGHEFTHRLQGVAAKEYNDLRNIVQGMDYFRARLAVQQEKNPDMDMASLVDEAVADTIGAVIHEQDALEQIADAVSPNIVQRLLNFFRGIRDAVTGKEREGVDRVIDTLIKAAKKGKKGAKKLGYGTETAENADGKKSSVDYGPATTGRTVAETLSAHGVKEGEPVSADTIRAVFKEMNTDRINGELFDIVADTLEVFDMFPKITFSRELMNGLLGEYNVNEHTIEYNLNELSSEDSDKKDAAHTIVHELIHAMTVRFLEYDHFHFKTTGDFATDAAIKRLSEELRYVARLLKDKKNPHTRTASGGRMYGAKNVKEMIAELSNPVFREAMAQTVISRAEFREILKRRAQIDKEVAAEQKEKADAARIAEETEKLHELYRTNPVLRKVTEGNPGAVEALDQIVFAVERYISAVLEFFKNAGTSISEKLKGPVPDYLAGIVEDETDAYTLVRASLDAFAQHFNRDLMVDYTKKNAVFGVSKDMLTRNSSVDYTSIADTYGQISKKTERDMYGDGVVLPNGKVAQRAQTDKVTKKILRKWKSHEDMDNTSTAMLAILHDMWQGTTGVPVKGLYDRVMKLAGEIAGNASEQDTLSYEAFAEMRKYFKGTTVNISEYDAKDIPDFGAFRKSLFGKVNLRIAKEGDTAGTQVDSAWQEWTELFGEGLFPSDIGTQSDMVKRLADLLQSAYRKDTIELYTDAEERAAVEQEIAQDIISGLTEISGVSPAKALRDLSAQVDAARERVEFLLDGDKTAQRFMAAVEKAQQKLAKAEETIRAQKDDLDTSEDARKAAEAARKDAEKELKAAQKKLAAAEKQRDDLLAADEARKAGIKAAKDSRKADIAAILEEMKASDNYASLVEQFGAFEPGEKPARNVVVPRKRNRYNRVSRTIRTVLEAEVTREQDIPLITDLVEKGVFSYTEYSDKKAIEDAEVQIRIDGGSGNSYLNWHDQVRDGRVNKKLAAQGWALYNAAATAGKAQEAVDILVDIVHHQRDAAQALQAGRILKQLSPSAQLYAATKEYEKMRGDLWERHGFAENNRKRHDKVNDAMDDLTGKREELNGKIAEIGDDAAEETPEAGKRKKPGAKQKKKPKRGISPQEMFNRMLSPDEIADALNNEDNGVDPEDWLDYISDGLEKAMYGKARPAAEQPEFIEDTVIRDLIKFAEQYHLPRKKSDRKPRTAVDRIRDFFTYRENYAEAWNVAVAKFREDYADDPQAIRLLEDWMNGTISYAGSGSDNVLMSAVAIAALDGDVKLKNLVNRASLGDVQNIEIEVFGRLSDAIGKAARENEAVLRPVVSRWLTEQVKRKPVNIEAVIGNAVREDGIKANDLVRRSKLGDYDSAHREVMRAVIRQVGVENGENTVLKDAAKHWLDAQIEKNKADIASIIRNVATSNGMSINDLVRNAKMGDANAIADSIVKGAVQMYGLESGETETLRNTVWEWLGGQVAGRSNPVLTDEEAALRQEIAEWLGNAEANDILPAARMDITEILDRDTQKAIREMGVKMSELIRRGKSDRDALGEQIAKMLSQSYGLTDVSAAHIADVLLERYNETLAANAQAALEQRFNSRKDRDKIEKTISDRLYELANLGAFSDPEFNRLATNEILRGEYDIHMNTELVDRFLDAPTQEARDEILKKIYIDLGKQMPATLADKFNAWRYLSMLLNVATHGRNIISTGVFAPVVLAKDVTATTIETMCAPLLKGHRTKSFKVTPELLKAGWHGYDEMRASILKGGKYQEFDTKNEYIAEGRRYFDNPFFEFLRKLNSMALDGEDGLIARPHYAVALAQYAAANGISAEELMHGSGEAVNAAKAYAVQEAAKATFRDINQFSEFMSKFGKATGMEDNFFAKKAETLSSGMLPFRKTPADVTVRAFDYSPAGIAKGAAMLVSAVKTGNTDPAAAIDELAAGMTGTGLFLLGGLMFSLGILYTNGGDDDDKRKFEKSLGHQQWSLEIAGKSVSVSWLTPLALPILMGATFRQSLDSGEGGFMALAKTFNATLEPMLEMSMLSSVNDTLDSVSGWDTGEASSIVTILANMGVNYLTQFVGTIFGQMERASQPYRMSNWTGAGNTLSVPGVELEFGDVIPKSWKYPLARLSARVPGIDFNQTVYRDVFGRTQDNGGVVSRILNQFINPAYVKNVTEEDVDRLVEGLYEVGKSVGVSVLPDYPEKKFSVRVSEEDVPKKQYEWFLGTYKNAENGTVEFDMTMKQYDRFQETVGGIKHGLLQEAINSKQFNALSDEDKCRVIGKFYQYANYAAKKEYCVNTDKENGDKNKTLQTALDKSTDTWLKLCDEAFRGKMNVADVLSVYLSAKDIESYHQVGKPISNSASIRKMAYINGALGSQASRNIAYRMADVADSVIGYNIDKVNQELSRVQGLSDEKKNGDL